MSWWVVALFFGLLPVATLGLTVFNLAVWPRGTRRSGAPSADTRNDVSVLIPARDVEATIESCVRSVLDAATDVGEILVYDDRSSDNTAEIVERLADHDRVRLISGSQLPDGWVGKPHACHRLAGAAEGEILVYLDADTFLKSGGLGRLLSVLEEGPAGEADLVTAVPRQEYGSLGEALVVPLLHVTYTSWLPLPLVWHTSDPRFLAANGQVMALRREALEEIGGFESVRADVVDDMAIGRAFKRANRRVVFADGFEIARCRMYESWDEVWRGFSKNLYEGIGESPAVLALIFVLYFGAFILPWLAAPVAWLAGATTIAGAGCVGVACNLALRASLAVRFRHPFVSVLLHVVGVGALLAIAGNSYLWHRRGEIQWAGRTYSARSEREAGEAP